MANEVTGSALSSDQEKYIVASLTKRSYLKLVLAAMCDKETQPQGAGVVANFVRYKRMNVPLTPLPDDGQDPPNSTFTLDTVSVTLDEWGDVLTITNVAQLSTKHPIMQQAQELLADNAARVMDREVGIVLLAGTNVQYGAGAVVARSALSTTDKLTDTVVHRARITLGNAGAPPRGGPNGGAQQVSGSGNLNGMTAYVAVAGMEIMADLMAPSTSMGSFASAAVYGKQSLLFSAEIGQWLGVRWVESNFLPRFKLLGSVPPGVASGAAFGTDTPVVTAGAAGTLAAATYFYKVTRKDLLRGYEEDISLEHSTACGATGSFTFNFSSLSSGYVYNLYFGASTGDANLKLASQNIAVGTTVTVTAVPASTVTPPPSNKVDGSVATVYPIFIFGEKAVSWVGFYGMRFYVSENISIPGNVLKRRRSIGYTFFGKSVIRDQTRLLRVEVAASF